VADDPIDWAFAASVARRVTGREPFSESYHADGLDGDFQELTAQAEELVALETGLRSLSGPARGRVTDRTGWIDANIAGFRRLLKPLTDKLGDRLGSNPLTPITSRVAGAEIGALLGWMSGRVLGQYDLLVVEEPATAALTPEADADGQKADPPEDQDLVYYVGPNVLALEKRFSFPPREFRLWLALHEVTHRAQFTAIPWMRSHYLGLIQEVMGAVDPDPRRFLGALGRMVDDLRSGTNPLDEGGVATLFATDEQRAALDRVGGLMSLLEGHGDITMDRAGTDHIPNAERFGRVLRQRRRSSAGLTKLVQKLIGLEAKLAQYEQGEAFIEAVEAAGGPEALDRAWAGPQWLPSMDEIRAPDAWLARCRIEAAPGDALVG
jgi:coenzyme F420 biosynthesis associated uncharacterized protein